MEVASSRALDTYCSWPLTGTTSGHSAANAHPRKAQGGPGDPLQATGLPTLAHLWGMDGYHQGKHHP